ncbi:MAG: malto-oligosyltrehalose synthase [Gemmataceae bacterium]|nr:malto-oligosyltrehalose synthase [Gemmataceae bacterium]
MNDIAPPTPGPLPDTETLLARIRQRRRLPISTYRFQLHRGFSFRDATAVVPYLAKLGVTDCYCSPYLQARAGSTHGYDITDHNALNPELGSEGDYDAFTAKLAEHHLGQVLDFVPNHMGVDPVTNHWWREVLEDGPSSPHARFFDIDWDPVKQELRGKVLLPILGDHYGKVLERGELQLAFDGGAFVLRYFEHNLPVDPGQVPRILKQHLDTLKTDLKDDDAHLQEFLSILTSLEHLPPSTDTTPERVAERQREKKVARDRLARLVEGAPRVRQHIDEALKTFNGEAGKADSFDLLHDLLEVLPYRLAYWRTAIHEINYRRFFDINELAGIRMEEPAVFAATHALILRLIRQGKITGLRLDHLDGLFDPAGYLENLQEAVILEWATDEGAVTEDARQAVHAWREVQRQRDPGGVAERPFWVVAEKILSGNEALPESWPIFGTSGYDFMNDLNRLFVDPLGMKALKKAYTKFTSRELPFAEVVYDGKKLITATAMASELNVLAHALNRISERDRRLRDFTLASLRQALREVVACFPVYRAYVNASTATEADRHIIEVALARARRRNPAMEASVFEFIRAVLMPQAGGDVTEDEYRRRLLFAMKFQQYTGPVQAKGVEDTAFYRYNVLASLNEVGGDPQRVALPAQFHDLNRKRREVWPSAMLATATHDTKRGEDARARINVLSEVPVEWRKAVARWAQANAGHRTKVDGEPAPDRNDEYLIYQALLGAWPAEPDGTVHEKAPADVHQRVREYMTKAIKEAKVHTSWINPYEPYDNAVGAFLDKSLTGPRATKFLASFLPFQQRIARTGMVNSLAQVVLKTVAPGVPDIYQGTELWDLSLVDPDNRRPVDYEARRRILDELEPILDGTSKPEAERTMALTALLANWQDGRIKLFLTASALRLRRRLPLVFQQGDYLPLEAEGERADHVVAVARRHEAQRVVAVAPRLIAHIVSQAQPLPIGAEVWQSTWLNLPADFSAGAYRNVLTGVAVQTAERQGRIGFAVADVLRACPVAMLEAVGS